MQTNVSPVRRETFIVRVHVQDDRVQRVDVEGVGTAGRRSLESLEQLMDHLRRHIETAARSGIAAQLSTAEAFWPTYRSARLRILAQPFQEVEARLAAQVAQVLQDYLGLDAPTAAYQARRNVFHRRERLLHETLTLDLAPERLGELLDAITVEGIDHLLRLPDDRGTLLVSLHYSTVSSLLCLWLAGAAARGTFSHLTVLLDSGPAGSLGLPASRVDELEAAGLARRSATTLVDMDTAASATRHLVARLRSGGTALVLPDAGFVPATEGKAVPLTLGRRQVGIARGAAWLAEVARCPIVPVHIRPDGDTYTIVFGAPVEPGAGGDAAGAIQSVAQGLLERTVLRDPAPWEGWLLLPDARRQPASAAPARRGEEP